MSQLAQILKSSLQAIDITIVEALASQDALSEEIDIMFQGYWFNIALRQTNTAHPDPWITSLKKSKKKIVDMQQQIERIQNNLNLIAQRRG